MDYGNIRCRCGSRAAVDVSVVAIVATDHIFIHHPVDYGDTSGIMIVIDVPNFVMCVDVSQENV